MLEMAQTPNKVSEGFKYGKTFAEVERQVLLMENQINIFDLMEDKNGKETE